MKDPQKLGIGIDEDSAVLVEDNRRLSVAGKSQVMFIEARKGGLPLSIYVLSAGGSFDLKHREPTRSIRVVSNSTGGK
jgi:hypothetical protein